MKYFITLLIILSCFGCTHYSVKNIAECPGNIELSVELADKFQAIEDEALLKKALGLPGKGKLCQGQVYKTKENTHATVYRAWNSTNPNSKMGDWWAFQTPQGKVSQYRYDYEICYQWSPLDKLTRCTLKTDVKVVIGTGQSAYCNKYLTYPASPKKQIYMEDASGLVYDCITYDGEFSWKAVIE